MNNGRNVMTARARASRVIHVVLAGCLAIMASANTHAVSPSGYVYTQIDCPGLTNTGLLGINATGATVGNATDSNGNNVAFKYSGGTAGTCTPLPAMPAGFGLYAEDINDSGTIVGNAESPDGSYNEGFILQGSTYTLVPHPPQTFVEIRGINSAGIVAGDAWSTDTAGNTINGVGFIYDPSTGLFKDITVPTATFVIAKGINKAGQVVGNAFFSNQSLSSQGYLCAPNTGANIFCDPNTPGRRRCSRSTGRTLEREGSTTRA